RCHTPTDSSAMAAAMTRSPADIAPGRPRRRITAEAVVEATRTPRLNSRNALPPRAADRPRTCCRNRDPTTLAPLVVAVRTTAAPAPRRNDGADHTPAGTRGA